MKGTWATSNKILAVRSIQISLFHDPGSETKKYVILQVYPDTRLLIWVVYLTESNQLYA